MNQKIKEIAIKSGAGEWGDSIVPAMMDIDKFAHYLLEDFIKEASNISCESSYSFSREMRKLKRKYGAE